MHRILFVCLGNICRSPLAEGVFRAVAEAEREGLGWLVIESAGTGSWHVGEPPDARAIEAARERGIDISGLRARQIRPDDFDSFDLILCMDEDNHADLTRLADPQSVAKIRLFLDFAEETTERAVPDPYYGGPDGFELVLDLIQDGARGLASYLKSLR